VPYGITQCYLPPGRGDIPALTPAAAGTRFSDHNTPVHARSPPSFQLWLRLRKRPVNQSVTDLPAQSGGGGSRQVGGACRHQWMRQIRQLVLIESDAAACSLHNSCSRSLDHLVCDGALPTISSSHSYVPFLYFTDFIQSSRGANGISLFIVFYRHRDLVIIQTRLNFRARLADGKSETNAVHVCSWIHMFRILKPPVC